MKWLFFSLFALSLSGNVYSVDRCVDGASCSVTIIHLISDPGLYDKKEVIVRGYFVYTEKQSYLYLDSEKATHGLSEYSINLKLSKIEKDIISERTGGYVLIHGVFNQNDRGIGVPTAGSVLVNSLSLP
jgi:hypothetical protein